MNNYKKLNLYSHNIETCKKIKEAYDAGEQIVSIIKATGTGKSYIGLNLALEHKDEKIVWMVPTLAIKEHIEKTINDNSNLSVERDFPNLEIRTYSSLVDMTKEEIDKIPCDLLIVDELHHLGAPVWGERVNTFVDTHSDMKVFGMSAYSVRDRGTAYERDMVNPDTEELFSNTVVDRYDIYDAIIDGVLPMPFVKSVLVENSRIIEDLRETQKLKRVQGSSVYYEIDRVVDSIIKTIHKQEPVKEIVQNVVAEDGKYIYFCPVVSSYGNNDMDSIMKKMMEYLREKFPKKRIVFYKTTSDMGEVGEYNRECFYKDVDLDGVDASDTIRIMFAKNQYNEGVHAPNVDGVFLGRETGSDIVALEQIGRALSVRGDTSKKIEEYNKYTLEEVKGMAKSRDIKFKDDITKEELIELFVSPVIIDLADNIEFLQELETNLKDRLKERRTARETLTSRQVKILETWSTLDIAQRDLYNALMKLRENVQAYTWDDWYGLAKTYYEHHGNSEILSSFKTKNGYEYDENGVKLGHWCRKQRTKQDRLSQERKQKLEEIEFRFESNFNDLQWEKMYELALAYYKHHCNSEIPGKFKTNNGIDYDESGVRLGQWCFWQRRNQDRLSEERKQKLEEIEFRFESNFKDLQWEKMYELALAYYKHHGNSEIPGNFKTKNGYEYDENGVNLGSWCNLQRQLQDKLFQERKQKLEDIGFRFESNLFETRWQQMYELALAYYKHHGNSEIPGNFKTNNGIDYDESGVRLGQWCEVQRQQQSKMSEERKQKLEEIDFRFESNFKDLQWEKMYELTLAYYKHHGNSEIPRNFKTNNGIDYDENGVSLGIWCVHQRANQDRLSEERKQKLEDIGFRFESNLFETRWQQMYELALAYYKHHGNSEIPGNFKTKNGYEYDENGVNLGSWCILQRQLQDKLFQERKQKLEEIEFRFESNLFETRWQQMYELALAYYKHHGNSEIPGNFKTKNGIDYDENGENLYQWCHNQRVKQEKLNEERRKKLELIGFRFKVKNLNDMWENCYSLVKAYYEHYGNSNISQKFKTKNGIDYDENGVSLGIWCVHQRTRQDTLSEERRKKLELIGFRFETEKFTMPWEEWYNLAKIYYEHHGNLEIVTNFKTKNGKDYDENGVSLGIWCRNQRKYYDKLSEDRRNKLELIGLRFINSKENEENKKNLCNENGIMYEKYKMLKNMSYQELYAKIMYLIDNGYSLLVGDKLHEIFNMSNENMVLKYMVSKEEMITNYYINKKRRGV